MIKIAICDDEIAVCKELSRILLKIINEENVRCLIEEYTMGSSLIEKAYDYDLFFLDMDMPKMDGMDVGSEIIKRNPDCAIIIASGREDRFKETYCIRPLRFISKPFNEKEVRETVYAYRNQEIGKETFEVFRERKSYYIYQKDIEYVSAYKGYVELLVKDVLYRKNISMNQLEEQLDSRLFLKIHKSYIVNMRFITELQDNYMMVGKIRIPISRRNKRNVYDTYMKFDVTYWR